MKQCNYVVSYVNGSKVFTSKKSGKVLTGAARLACERAEAEKTEREQKAINEAVDNAFIMCWYEDNADIINAEQRATQGYFNNKATQGEGFILTNRATITIWPSAFGQGFTRSEARAWLKEIRAKRNAERRASMKRSNNTAHKRNDKAVDYVARRILGGKAMREGKRVKIVFTRKVITLRTLAWKGLPPRACGKIGVVKDGNTFKAWTFAGMLNNLPLWIISKVYAGLNFPVVMDITKEGGDDNPPHNDSNKENTYETFCDEVDKIIHANKEEKAKLIAITGWALTLPTLRNIETALEDEDMKEQLATIFRKFIAKFIHHGLDCMGWNYNNERGTEHNAVINFLRKRDTDKFPIFTRARYDTLSTFTAISAVMRCLHYAKKNSTQAVVIQKEIRPTLARVCRKLLQAIQPEHIEEF